MAQNRVIVKKPAGDTLMAEFRDGIPLPDMGESIEISGTPETDLYRIHLLRAVWRKTDAIQTNATADAPMETPLKSLFWLNDRYIIDPRFYGQTLTVKGTLKDYVADETGDVGFSCQQTASASRLTARTPGSRLSTSRSGVSSRQRESV